LKSADVLFATANTNRDGTTGTYTTLYTAPGTVDTPGAGEGAVVSGIRINAIGTTTAGSVRIWRHNGTACFLVKELLVTALTPNGTSILPWQITTAQGADATGYLPLNLHLEAGDSIKVSTNNAESFHATADIGLY
jgi:hypothetical protein